MTPWECGREGNPRYHRPCTPRRRPQKPDNGGEPARHFLPALRSVFTPDRTIAFPATSDSLGARNPRLLVSVNALPGTLTTERDRGTRVFRTGRHKLVRARSQTGAVSR